MELRAAITLAEIPDPGTLLGTPGSTALIQTINEQLGSTNFFGRPDNIFSAAHNVFIRDFIQPLKLATNAILQVSQNLTNPDIFRALNTVEALGATPPCMQLPILMYAPVRKLLTEGRIEGYGFNPDYLPDEDVYDRLLNNGYIPDVLEAPEPVKGYAPLAWEWRDDDPELTIDAIEAIASTRNFIDTLLENTLVDPTNVSIERS